MKTNIIISPIFNQFMSGRIWMGLDCEKIEENLKKLGYDTSIIEFHNLLDRLDDIPVNSILFYSSIYNENYLKYIQNTVYFIQNLRPDIVLIPQYDQLIALENKGFQEYMKQRFGIEKVQGKYYGDINELVSELNTIKYPFVLKENKGALSSGVHLIHSEEDLVEIHKKLKKQSFKNKLAQWLNKRNSFKKDLNLHRPESLYKENFNQFFEKRIPVIKQDFIPNLKFDYKILQFGSRFFGVKRYTRDNDFRASGSGKVSFEDIPEIVLDYVLEIVKKLNTPFVSLDIGINDKDECFLFEFQGTAFGPLALTESKYHYELTQNGWNKIVTQSNLEEEYANAIVYFIKNQDENS